MQQIFWAIDAALVFARPVQVMANRIINRLHKYKGGGKGYNAVHLRIEADWIEHCKVWTSKQNTNCLTNTWNLHNVLQVEGVSKDMPLYISGEFFSSTIAEATRLKPLANMYDLVTKDMLLPDKLTSNMTSVLTSRREMLAAVEYAVCLAANTFVGNSVSSFTGHLLLARQMSNALPSGARSFHYNGGSTPLADLIYEHMPPPPTLTKWVFVATSATNKFDDMTRVAVLSAMRTNPQLTRICIFIGEQNELARWLIAQRVRVIHHTPAWAGKLRQGFEAGSKKWVAYSPLYKSFAAMLATWVRLDIPRLGFTDKFVLYTDTDVMFVRPITLGSFPLLPKYFLVGTEGEVDQDVSEPTYNNVDTLQSRAGIAAITKAACPHIGRDNLPCLDSFYRERTDMCGRLYENVRLNRGEYIVSSDGHVLCLTLEGPIVRYRRDTAALSAECPLAGTYQTVHCPDCHRSGQLVYQGDGNLVLVSGTGAPLMATRGEIANAASQRLEYEFFRLFLPRSNERPPSKQRGIIPWVKSLFFGRSCKRTPLPSPNIAQGKQVNFNMGIMLINVEGMSGTYDDIISATFSEKNIGYGLYFGRYGPGDQGALCKFYEGKLLGRPWPTYNWKAYWGVNATTLLVHFHGPKPHDMLLADGAGAGPRWTDIDWERYWNNSGAVTEPSMRGLVERLFSRPSRVQRFDRGGGRKYVHAWVKYRSRAKMMRYGPVPLLESWPILE